MIINYFRHTRLYFLLLLLMGILFSCSEEQGSRDVTFSFYHWKSRATMNEVYQKALEVSQSQNIYLHYFDVDVTDGGIFPVNVVKEINFDEDDYGIVPVVYITNKVLKNEQLKTEDLALKIKNLVDQISEHYFEHTFSRIQIDCDWTMQTKNAYFDLLRLLQESFEVEVTIRLHQIKFQEKTGIPPVDKGVLMLYNVGDLKNKHRNSILESEIVQKYINSETSYPMKLSLALPLFSQTIVFNKDDEIKIIKDTDKALYRSDDHFTPVSENIFEVVKDTLYKGFFLSKGYLLKTEPIDVDEIIQSEKLVRESQLEYDEIIFYHLDENSLKNIKFEHLIHEL